MRVVDYLMSILAGKGVEHVFTVTGRGALFLTDALAANKKLSAICTHHEQAAAYAANAYADAGGGIGVCLVSTGCAATNAMTGLLNAWQDGLPCVYISGQNKLQETSRYTKIPIRTYGQQEADIISLVYPITKYAVMLSDPAQIRYEIEKALYLAQEGRKGPVWIDIPLDVQNMRIKPEELDTFIPNNVTDLSLPNDINLIVDSLRVAERPVLLIGSGIRAADAIEDLECFIDRTSIPTTFSLSAVDIYGTFNKLSVGSVGPMACTRAGNFSVQNADLLIVLGCRLSSMTTGEYCKFARNAKIIIVDIDVIEHSKAGIRFDKLIKMDVKSCLQAMNAIKSLPIANNNWVDRCLYWKRIFPICEERFRSQDRVDLYELSEALSCTLPDNAILLTDSGLVELVLPGNTKFKKGQRCIHPVSQGAMGVALPALVGAYYRHRKPVIAVVGDGSIMMNLQELETVKHNKIPAKIFVINNNLYSIIRKRQAELFGSRTIGTDLSNGLSCPNFEDLAKLFDFSFKKITVSENLSNQIFSVLEQDGSVLCEVMGVENQGYIHCSYTRNKNKKIVHRPIEDQSPYLDRELFLSEMIVEPIDQ